MCIRDSIQADIKTISALGGYAASVITAVTAQNTLGVQSVYPLPVDMVEAQITSVMDVLRPHAVKIGMVYDAGIVTTIVDCLQTYTPVSYTHLHEQCPFFIRIEVTIVFCTLTVAEDGHLAFKALNRCV